jgi:microsomal epoxide hydrolase
MRTTWLRVLLLLIVAAAPATAADLQFTTSDGVHLHVIEAGPRDANTIVFVPGWTMPAWIFKPQIDYFAQRYHVLALDPRGQGSSDIPLVGYTADRRGRDIGEMIAAFGGKPVVLVGWSLGVLDSLAYVRESGDARLAGLVLIDNSVGEDPPPVASRALPARRGPRLEREEQMRRFVAGMFRVSPGQAYLAALTDAALNTPPAVAAQLANYAVPRTYWKQAVLSMRKPVLYMVRPRFAAQAGNLAMHLPGTETVVFETAGHALFIDEAQRFDQLLASFIQRRVWP